MFKVLVSTSTLAEAGTMVLSEKLYLITTLRQAREEYAVSLP